MNWFLLLPVLLGGLTAYVAVRWIYFKILKVAFEKRLVDNPEARKLQKRPVPLVGGLAVFFERVKSAEGKLVWRDGVNGVMYSCRPKVMDFSGLELATEDGVLFFPRIASKWIDGKCAIHLNLLKMQLGDGILWKKRYISLSNPTQVFKWVETLPNGMRLFEDEQERCFLQQDPDHPLVAE